MKLFTKHSKIIVILVIVLMVESCVSEVSLLYNGTVSFQDDWTNFSKNDNVLLVYQKTKSLPLPSAFGGWEIFIEIPKEKFKGDVEFDIQNDSIKAYYVTDLHHYRKPNGNISGVFQILKIQKYLISVKFNLNIVTDEETEKFIGEYDFKRSTNFSFFNKIPE